jgi:hypothetical protein
VLCCWRALLLLGPLTMGHEPIAHPLHSALTEISYQAETSEATIRIRIFADDFGASLPPTNEVSADTAMSQYARATLALINSTGRPSLLEWEGVDTVGDLLVLRLRAKLDGGLAHARVLSAVLWERFPDQVNIVRVSSDGRVTTLLFTRGDRAKPVT